VGNAGWALAVLNEINNLMPRLAVEAVWRELVSVISLFCGKIQGNLGETRFSQTESCLRPCGIREVRAEIPWLLEQGMYGLLPACKREFRSDIMTSG